MLFRHVLRSAGLAAHSRPLFHPTTTPRAAAIFLPAALLPHLHHHHPTRLSSSDSRPLPSTLTPPWQISDLPLHEQEAYKQYGPDYVDHLAKDRKRSALHKVKRRALRAARMKARYGKAWYDMLQRAKKRWTEEKLPSTPQERKGEAWRAENEMFIEKCMDEQLAAAGGRVKRA